MKHSLILKIASVIGLLFCIGHSMGYPWLPAENTVATRIAADIRATSFSFAGQSRTLWNFYIGFGIIISVLLLLKAVLLWMVSLQVRQFGKSVQPMLVALLLAYLANALLSWTYFFMLPALFSIVISVLILCSIIKIRGMKG